MKSPRRGAPAATAAGPRRSDRAALPPRPRWILPEPPDAAVVGALQDALRLPSAVCRLLALRGHADPDAARAFLNPSLDSLHPPGGLLDAHKAAHRLARAVKDREKVVVHGDYDVDGVSASVLLTSWIRALGGRADAIVPDRQRDGYDLSGRGVERAKACGASVLVTVDCGIAAHKAVRKATADGMDVIVTDHHRPGEAVPNAYAVVNPRQPGCRYPNKGICGAGVAFKVGQLLAQMLDRPAREALGYLDLAALATIADMAPLEGENRAIARHGLGAMDDTQRPGLRALKHSAEIEPGRPVDSASVSYSLAPRINAAGRVGDARDALALLLTDDPTDAQRLAAKLESNNLKRRRLERQVADEAFAALQHTVRDGSPAKAGVVVAGDGWHSGVVGIVATRLVERFYRPSVVVAFDGNMGRGSARSIPAFDLHAAIASCAEHLERFGGHHQAAGFDIRRESLPAFRAAFERAARRELGGDEPVPQLRADIEIGLDEIDRGLHRHLRDIGPFGQGNPEPVFVARGVRLQYPKVVKRRHLKFRMTSTERTASSASTPRQGPPSVSAIGFGLADAIKPESLGGVPGPPPAPWERAAMDPAASSDPWQGARLPPVDVAFTLMENTFRGRTTIEARVRDIRPAAAASPAGRTRSAGPATRPRTAG